MARIPRRISRRVTPSGRVGGVPIPFDIADTGAEIEARGLGALGRGIGTLGEALFKIEQAEGISQFATARNLANADIQAFELAQKTNVDPDSYQDRFTEAFEGMNVHRPKNLTGAKRYDEWLKGQEALWRVGVAKLANRKVVQIAEGAYITNLSSAYLTGNSQEVNRIIDEAEQIGVITPEEAAIERIKVPGKIDGTLIQTLLNQASQEASVGDFIASSNIIAQAEELLNTTTNLDAETERLMRSRVEASKNMIETTKKLAIDQKDEAIGTGFLDLLINKLNPAQPQLTFDTITASGLSLDAKLKWESLLRTFDNYSEGELKEAFTDKGEVLADIYNKIDTGRLTDELDTMVGKGLSPVTAQRIKKEIREPYKKDSEQFFKRIFGWSPELGFENELSSFLYEKTLREWESEIKRQDATGEKIIEIGRSIARPYFLEHLKTVLPSDTNIARMMELALGEEIKEPPEPPAVPPVIEVPVEGIKVPLKPIEVKPATYPEFRAEVSRLKSVDMKKAEEYYNAWIGTFKK